jgi:hypothetical protein
MTKNDGWDELAQFLDVILLKAIKDESEGIHIAMYTFGSDFLVRYPDKEKYLRLRYLDFYRFVYSELNISEKKLFKIFQKYNDIGHDDLGREIEIAIFYVKNTTENQLTYQKNLIDLIHKNYRNNNIHKYKEMVPEFFEFVENTYYKQGR